MRHQSHTYGIGEVMRINAKNARACVEIVRQKMQELPSEEGTPREVRVIAIALVGLRSKIEQAIEDYIVPLPEVAERDPKAAQLQLTNGLAVLGFLIPTMIEMSGVLSPLTGDEQAAFDKATDAYVENLLSKIEKHFGGIGADVSSSASIH